MKVLKQLGAIAVVALLCNTAQAALVTQWSYYDEIGFSEYTGNGIRVSGNSGEELGLPTTLRWGSGSRNSLTTAGSSTGTVNTFGMAPGAGMVHHNHVNPSDFSLEFAALRNVLHLTPIAPNPPFDGGFTIEGPTLTFELLFHESVNRPRSGVCADGTSIFNPLNIRGCRDFFVLANPESLAPIQFPFQDWLYTIAIIAPGVLPLRSQACNAVGLSAGCIGMMTRENGDTTLQPYFTILAQPLPLTMLQISAASAFDSATLLQQVDEPAPYTLLGAGVLLLALMRRLRNRHGG